MENIIKVKRKTFLNDLNTCLTVLKRLESNLFLCEYVTPALEIRIIKVKTI